MDQLPRLKVNKTNLNSFFFSKHFFIKCFVGIRMINDPYNRRKSVSIKIVMLSEDEDDSKIFEIIHEAFAIREQFKDIYVQLYRLAKISNYFVAFAAFGTLKKILNLNQLQTPNFTHLTGEIVWDYLNPITHPNDTSQLEDFYLGYRIPSIQSESVLGVFYLAKIQKRISNQLKDQRAVVIIPFQANNTQFLDDEVRRLMKRKIYYRHMKNGVINGHRTPILAIQLGNGKFSSSLIEGLKTSYVAYTCFSGGETIILDKKINHIFINNFPMTPFFDSLLLSNYTQDLMVDWGLFKCKLNNSTHSTYIQSDY